MGCSQPWLGSQGCQGGARATAGCFGEQCPHASAHTHRGTWHSRGCPSWQGLHRRPVGIPGAGSVSPPTARQKEGLSTGLGGLAAPQTMGMVGPWGATPGCSSTHPRSTRDWHRGAFSFTWCHPRPGTLTTHQHRIHFISPKGGTEGCQLSLLRYQRRPKRHARGPSACMVSASSGTLFSGAAGKGTGRLPAHGRGTPRRHRWWHARAVPGKQRAEGGCRYLGTVCSSRRGWRARGWHR